MQLKYRTCCEFKLVDNYKFYFPTTSFENQPEIIETGTSGSFYVQSKEKLTVIDKEKRERSKTVVKKPESLINISINEKCTNEMEKIQLAKKRMCDDCRKLMNLEGEIEDWENIHQIIDECFGRSDSLALLFGESKSDIQDVLHFDYDSTIINFEGEKDKRNISMHNSDCLIF